MPEASLAAAAYDGERFCFEFEYDFGDSWKHEVAAYELSAQLGWDLVPLTIVRAEGPPQSSLWGSGLWELCGSGDSDSICVGADTENSNLCVTCVAAHSRQTSNGSSCHHG
mgnify:CR=1 FL=1